MSHSVDLPPLWARIADNGGVSFGVAAQRLGRLTYSDGTTSTSWPDLPDCGDFKVRVA